ncbi:MAG: insulinase family protein [Gammaproteobacteria bacterium]|nr:insulinase family protein [Gammaproteobacteria bacterium]
MTVCTTLANGVRILSRPLPGRRSAALGFWLLNGSRHEVHGQHGYAHLLEHLLFHGSGRFADHFEALGGHVNARTMRELTAFHGLVTGDRLRLLARLFTSMLLDPRLGAAELAAELPAVGHERRMASMSPWDEQEAFALRRVWDGHPLACPILGAGDALRAVSPAAMQEYCAERLRGPSIWVVAAGDVHHDELVEACQALERLPAGKHRTPPPPDFTPRALHGPASGDGSDLLWVMPVPALGDPSYPALLLAEQIAAGAPLSARLQRELRERLGLAYAVESRLELYTDCGLWWIRVQCEPGREAPCITAVESVMEALVQRGPTREEVIHNLTQLQARWTLEEEDPECVMERIAHEIACLDRVTALNERLARLAALDPDDIRHALADAWRRHARFVWGAGKTRRASNGDRF